MGGWDEEAWYARLQRARALRTLKDEGGFVSEAIAAFNQRPHRAEPLYDLARYYREKGMNDASVLFSEAGLSLPMPTGDGLFVEDFVYNYGLKEEFSIAANYARDPERKDRGFAACDWLALNRESPKGSRDLARWNLKFYVQPARALMPSFASVHVGFTAPEGFRPNNPSVARHGDELVLVQRCVNYAIKDNCYQAPDGGPIRTRNFLVRIDDNLRTLSANEIFPPRDLPTARSQQIQGFEDARLFSWKDELWFSADFRELNADAWPEQVLGRLDESNLQECRLTDFRMLKPEGPRLRQKNWMPIVEGDALQFVYHCDPTRIVDENGKTVKDSVPAVAADHFRGGSQAIFFDSGWLFLIHEVAFDGAQRRQYRHRFVWLDGAKEIRRISRPFYFEQNSIEFAAGLAWHPDKLRLVISYGVNDIESWIATVAADDVRKLLDNAESLTTGTRRLQGPALARLAPATCSTVPNSAVPDLLLAAACPNRVVTTMRTEPLVNTTRSTWVPPVPLAGTELMVAGLKERLGDELERINLQVNYPGGDQSDKRARIVWMHHDINQQWVQWCKNKELLDLVDCFVFVSYWQRERYLNAFSLPPQRCVVLRHALEIDRETRRWDTGPILRCAYTSTPFRGLNVLLAAWERLKPTNAELHIWSSMKLYLGDDEPYQYLYERACSMRRVFYHGIVPNAELRAALRNIHVLAYPCTFAETACLAAIEAMAAGCRLIVPSLGALPETTAGYARIYPSNPVVEEHVTAFSQILDAELANPWAGDPDLCLRQQAHCAAVYDWARCLREWRQLIEFSRLNRRG